MPIAREAWPFFIVPLLGSVLFVVVGLETLAVVALLLALFVVWFFRDPKRSFDGPYEIVVAPADGTVTAIDTIEDAEIGPGRRRRIVTFLSAFNVHIQRNPTEGQVTKTLYVPGRKVAAFRRDADRVNENHLTVIQRNEGELIGVRQIAGLVARRVVPYLRENDRVGRGSRLGIIKFGSRVDLVLPEHYEILVEKGDRLFGGATAVAMPTDPSSPPPNLD